jgi:hypothetical protein
MRYWVDQDKHAIARQRVEPLTRQGQEAELLALFSKLTVLGLAKAEEYRQQGFTINTKEIGLTEVPEDWFGTSNILSRRICDKMWGEGSVETEDGYETFRKACLTCHGGVTEKQNSAEGALSNYPVGIDCLYCHQEGDEKSWQKKHLDSDSWRLSSPKDKQAQGMSDMVNTANQASMCLDCHVGNRDKNMFVTHQMYAAGHPPLPSIEVQTFCDQMPQHWQSPSELHDNLEGDPSRDKYFEINYPGLADRGPEQAGATHWDTRKMFIGALVARRKAVALMVQTASTSDWGDYALYDCAACHHELQTESLRQQRYLTSIRPAVPGRPRQHEWQSVLLDIGYRLGGPQIYQKISGLESRLAGCFDEKPFGSSVAVQTVGEDLLMAIDTAIDAAQRRPFNASSTEMILKLTADTDASRLLTYDAARQVVWAVNVMAKELQREGRSLPESVNTAIKELNAPELTGLDPGLPAGRKQFIYPDYLGDDFDRRAIFDPEQVASTLRRVSAGLER